MLSNSVTVAAFTIAAWEAWWATSILSISFYEIPLKVILAHANIAIKDKRQICNFKNYWGFIRSIPLDIYPKSKLNSLNR